MTLVAPAVETDADAFRDLVRPHLPALHRFATVLVARSDTDDLVQDTLARAWVKREQFDDSRGAAVSWLMAIMADRARQRWRVKHPSLTTHAEPEATHPADHDRSVPPVDPAVLDLRRAVDALPARQRTAVVLYHYLDLPVSEVAALMRCSTGTVKSNLFDARRSLAARLGDHDG